MYTQQLQKKKQENKYRKNHQYGELSKDSNVN